MAALNDSDLDARIDRRLRALGLVVRDEWLGAESAAAYLKISKPHFLRIANRDDAPACSGAGRMRRWRMSALDTWQRGGRAGD